MFLNCYLRNYGHIAEYLLVAIIIPLYFQKTDISLHIWYVHVHIYANGHLPLGMYVYLCYYVEILWNVHLINCISQKMFHSFSMFF